MTLSRTDPSMLTWTDPLSTHGFSFRVVTKGDARNARSVSGSSEGVVPIVSWPSQPVDFRVEGVGDNTPIVKIATVKQPCFRVCFRIHRSHTASPTTILGKRTCDDSQFAGSGSIGCVYVVGRQHPTLLEKKKADG